MKARNKDPLLATTHIILTLLLAMFSIALVGLAIAIAALPFPLIQEQITTLELRQGVSAAQYSGRLAMGVILAGLFVASGFIFTLQLRRIIQSVGDGDPFQPENGTRLQRMGVCMVGIVACGAIQPYVAQWVNELLNRSDQVTIHNVSADGLLLALILFILARVFRHGAAMREDLEGTV
jgi:hypothetical protein